jgi:D-3-phosphoglycerate dehydrogenase / 2-oxoglutarate reductase
VWEWVKKSIFVQFRGGLEMKSKEKLRVVLLENINGKARELFEANGMEVLSYPSTISAEELVKLNPHVIGMRSRTKLPEEQIAKLKNLFLVACYCIGYEGIDLLVCQKSGIMVMNDPFSNIQSVAELTIWGVIGLLRDAVTRSMEMKKGRWYKTSDACYEVHDSLFGIIGMGRVGNQVAQRLYAMGGRIAFFDIDVKKECITVPSASVEKCKSLDELLALEGLRLITIHIDGREENRNIYNRQFFKKVPKGVFIMNLSRGSVLVEEALAEALRKHRVAGAYLDVHTSEVGNGHPFQGPLRRKKRVSLTPHLGGSTEEAQRRTADSTTRRALAYINEGLVEACPYYPNQKFEKPRPLNSRRILWWHPQQKHGMAAWALTRIAGLGFNLIDSPILSDEKQAEAALAIFDIEDGDRDEGKLLTELQAFPQTYGVRII